MPPKQASQIRGKFSTGPQASTAIPSRTAATSSGNPSKRKQGPQGSTANSDPRAAKRTKIYESRSIAAQSSHAALQNGELNVQSFVNTIAFEINALDESMRRSRTSGASRAFQRVPFTMRRRTAAHNYKRIPKRLHKRAKREMAEDNTPTVNSRTRKPKTSRAKLRAETARRLGILAKRKRLLKIKKNLGSDSDAISTRAARPKIRRNGPNELPLTVPRYRKRQLNKTWLPTHVWHAKRARMTPPSNPLWGFSIPLTPNQKNYRPTHRVQWEKGAMCWDMSYVGTIGVFGKENILQNLLQDIGLIQESLWNDRGRRWRNGAVHWNGNLSRKVKNTIRFIGPAIIIWNPASLPGTTKEDSSLRQFMIRIHPSAFFETFNELLRLLPAYKPRPYLQDLRHEIGSIELTGPDATEALLGVLKPFETTSKSSHASKFQTLLGLRDPASLPLGASLAFSVLDPRLEYPPQKVQVPAAMSQQAQIRLLESISQFRNDEEVLEPYTLFDRDLRFKASKIPSQKSLNRRRGKTGPGITLKPGDIDPPIPIILLATRNSDEARIPGTWTVLLPWKCVKPVWHSLMHYPLSTGGNPTFGGVDEIRQLAFERGQPWFPGDIPGTDAGNAWEMREREARRMMWDRKPKGKRVKWETLDLGAGRKGEIGIGWNCDFEMLSSSFEKSLGTDMDMEVIVVDNSGEEEKEDHTMSGVAEESTKPNTEEIAAEAAKMPKTKSESPMCDISYLPKSIFTSHYSATRPNEPLAYNTVITVRIRILGRGSATTCARIYRLPPTPTPTTVDPKTQTEQVGATAATQPPPPSSQLPADLRAQWLALQKPCTKRTTNNNNSNPNPNPQNKDKKKKNSRHDDTTEARRQALVESLISSSSIITPHSNNGHYPLCPSATDLIGFVTTGGFSLRDGRGECLGAISARLAAEEMARYANPRDPAARLCVVRDAGQGVGWLGRWDVV